jgi:hypothetical protein
MECHQEVQQSLQQVQILLLLDTFKPGGGPQKSIKLSHELGYIALENGRNEHFTVGKRIKQIKNFTTSCCFMAAVLRPCGSKFQSGGGAICS